MAPPPRVRAFTREALPGAPAWVDPLLALLNEGVGQTARALGKGLTYSENFAAQLKDISFVAPAEVWRPVVFATGADDYTDPSYFEVEYRIDERGEVELQGLAAGLAAPNAYATLPLGYRPRKRKAFPGVSNNAFARINVYETGVVYLEVGSATWASFDGIRFKATTPALPDVTPGALPLIKHDLPDVGGLVPVYCRAEGVQPNQSSGAPVVDWEKTGNGSIRIKAVHGLTAGKKYQMRLLLFVR